MPPVLPTSRGCAPGDVLKDGRPFGVERLLGMGWEQSYKQLFLHGRLQVGDVTAVELKKGDLKRRSDGRALGAATVRLTVPQQRFLCDTVKADHAALAGPELRYWVRGVDAPDGGCGGMDLKGAFWDGGPAEGEVPLERKLSFSDYGFKKTISDGKAAVKKKLAKRKAWAGHLLLVSRVEGPQSLNVLETKLFFCRAAGSPVEMPWPAARQHRRVRSFEAVWHACASAAKVGGNARVVRVRDFLKECGSGGAKAQDRVKLWTSARAGLRLRCAQGPGKHVQFWKQRWEAGRGTEKQWVATKATFRKVWAAGRV